MKSKRDKIVVFEEFFRLKDSVMHALILFICLLLLFDVFILLSMSLGWLSLIPIGGILSCLFFVGLLIHSVTRLVKKQDEILFIELIFSSLLLLLGSTPTILYIFLNGNWNALESWDYFTVYFTTRNLILPLIVLVFSVYLYWMLIVHLCDGSELYYNCIKYKQDNER